MSLEFWHFLLLLLVANGAPILARNLLGSHFDSPLDIGMYFRGQPLLGPSKTLRGILFSIVITALASAILDYGFITGGLVASFSMAGDVTSSFIKRRFKMPSSSMAPLLDQIPESLLPALLMRHAFGLDAASVMMLVSIFIVLELVLSRILFYLGIRNTPY